MKLNFTVTDCCKHAVIVEHVLSESTIIKIIKLLFKITFCIPVEQNYVLAPQPNIIIEIHFSLN